MGGRSDAELLMSLRQVGRHHGDVVVDLAELVDDGQLLALVVRLVVGGHQVTLVLDGGRLVLLRVAVGVVLSLRHAGGDDVPVEQQAGEDQQDHDHDGHDDAEKRAEELFHGITSLLTMRALRR